MEAPPKGPYVKAAFFCERVLKEGDGVTSFIRVIDKLMQTAAGPSVPDSLPPITFGMTGVIMLNPGDAIGRHEFSIIMEPPSGFGKKTLGQGTVHFEGPERTANIEIALQMTFDQEGVYWFEILLDATVVLTRMPFVVQYTRVITPGTQT
jgi:hypothetical protein